jgi:hypothetical protein
MNGTESVWHREVVDPGVEQALRDLQQLPSLTQFYLAGGTGLALQLGHRRSLDLDFFNGEDFDEAYLAQRLQDLERFALVAKAPGTIHADIHDTKISLIAYAYPVLFPFRSFLGIRVADSRDIGCMKISAIASRGTKRAFVDPYAVCRQIGLKQLLDWFQEKFAKTNYNKVHVLKALTYFEDADQEPMPHMLVPLAWEEVKEFLATEAPRLL